MEIPIGSEQERIAFNIKTKGVFIGEAISDH
jgi:hypothetical protein